jgi:formylglycine-generating enzyme required for sulfatase activity
LPCRVDHFIANRNMTTPPITKTIDLGHGQTMHFVEIPAGFFWMGSRDNWDSEKPLHRVKIAEPFWLARYPVTQGQYREVTGPEPSHFKDDATDTGKMGLGRPVENISWNDARAFCQTWNEANPRSEWQLTLPTEAQWEYACRAGAGTDYHTGDGREALDAAGWFNGNSGKTTHPVGEKAENNYGLFDTHGNVWEWCLDSEDHDRYVAAVHAGTTLQHARPGGSKRLRGGSWIYHPDNCRAAYRDDFDTPESRSFNYGFRCVLFLAGCSHHS